MRRAAGLLAVLALGGCSPPRVDGAACDAGGRVAFALGETRGWFGTSPARARSVDVARIGGEGWVWSVEAPPHSLVAQVIGGGEPRRPVIAYGEALPGWRTHAAAAALTVGAAYSAEIWTDGGRAWIEWTHGSPLPTCAEALNG